MAKQALPIRTILRSIPTKHPVTQQASKLVPDNGRSDGKRDQRRQIGKNGPDYFFRRVLPKAYWHYNRSEYPVKQQPMNPAKETTVDSETKQTIAAAEASAFLKLPEGFDISEDRSMRLSEPVLPEVSRPAPVILPFEIKQSAKSDMLSEKLPFEASDTMKTTSNATQAKETGELGLRNTTIHDESPIKPRIVHIVKELLSHRQTVASQGTVVGFVPTMGALHEGHLDLMRAAARQCQEIWVSIYVNPTQFGVNEDLSTYPSTWEEDLAKIERLNEELISQELGLIKLVFRPESPAELYPYGIENTSHVIINPELTQILEGSSRPTFFRGVTTVVMKLLNIFQPNYVYFGQKDIQQFAVISRMIKEFHIQTNIRRVPTTREASGLALSSRNAYLGQRRRKAATILYKMLSKAKEVFEATPPEKRTRKVLVDAAMEVYDAERIALERFEFDAPHRIVNFKMDYLSLARPDTLQEIDGTIGSEGAIMSLAIYFEPLDKAHIKSWELLGINDDATTVRLIDNMLLGVE